MKTFRTIRKYQRNSTYFISIEVINKKNEFYIDIGFNKQNTIVNYKNLNFIKKMISIVIQNKNRQQIYDYIENEIKRLSS